MPIIVQPSLLVIHLPRKPQVRCDRGLGEGGGGRGDGGLPEHIVLCRPHNVAGLVGGLDGRTQVVVVVIGYGVLSGAIFGLDEQCGGGEFTVRLWAVLGGDFGWGCCGYTLTPALSHGERGRYWLLAFGNQAFVAV